MDSPVTGNPAQLNCRFIWTIEHFSSIDKKIGENIKSPEFYMGVENGHTSHWQLKLYPNGNKTESQGNLSLFLYLNKCNCQKVKSSLQLSIINWIGNSCKRVLRKKIFELGDNRGTTMLITREELLNQYNGYLLDDNLKLECVVDVASTDEASPQLRFYEEMMLTTSKCESNVFWPLYTDQRHVDTTILVENETFGVHKVVLAAKSKVFDAMFSHNMKEASTNTVTIDGCEPEVFREFLRFIYTDGVGNIDKVAVGLLILAERYGMENLKDVCSKEMLKNLTVNGACEMLIVSHTHNASWLKVQVLEYMIAELSEVTHTKEWSKMVNHPTLMEDLIKCLAES